MCDTLDALMVVMTQTSTDESARVLLRSLFEQSIRLSWVPIHPASNYPRWLSQAHVELRTIHNELAQYRQTYLTSAQLAKVPAPQRWTRSISSRGRSIRTGPRECSDCTADAISVVPRPIHQRLSGDQHLRPRLAKCARRHLRRARRALADRARIRGGSYRRLRARSPVLGITLVVAGQRFDWIDQPLVRRFVDRATAETTRRRERNRPTGPSHP